jgi:hypothetical protein
MLVQVHFNMVKCQLRCYLCNLLPAHTYKFSILAVCMPMNLLQYFGFDLRPVHYLAKHATHSRNNQTNLERQKLPKPSVDPSPLQRKFEAKQKWQKIIRKSSFKRPTHSSGGNRVLFPETHML